MTHKEVKYSLNEGTFWFKVRAIVIIGTFQFYTVGKLINYSGSLNTSLLFYENQEILIHISYQYGQIASANKETIT